MKHVAGLDEPAAPLIHGVLVTLVFLSPCLLLTWLTSRALRLNSERLQGGVGRV
jgi:hypothetical protein